MSGCVLVSASGPYLDPWHPFDVTSERLAAVLEPVTGPVTVRTDVEDALAEQRGDAGLLVVNIGDAGSGTPAEAARAGLIRHLEAGRPLLVLHVSSTAFQGWPEWESIIGGRWVYGTTFHPDRGPFPVLIDPGHPITTGLTDFLTVDEAYSSLRMGPGSTVLAHHVHDGEQHPIAWAHESAGARVVYVALGHDAEAYDAAGTQQLITRAASWLLGAPDRTAFGS